MIRFSAFGVRFTLPLLTLLLPPLCIRLGMKMQIGALILALSLHELAHIAAARLMRVEISEIRLTPFGGSARMENPYGLRSMQLAVVAAAGPAANLLCIIMLAAMTQWELLLAHTASGHVRIHLTLFLFNLLPALPLDGGRLLYCLLQLLTNRKYALKACIIIGRCLATILICLALIGFWRVRKLNLCLIMMSVFILVSAQDERDALCNADLRQLNADRLDRLPVRFYQMDAHSTVLEAIQLTRPGEANWFLLFKEKKPAGLLDGRAIADYIRSGGSSDAELGRLPLMEFTQGSNRSAQVHLL